MRKPRMDRGAEGIQLVSQKRKRKAPRSARVKSGALPRRGRPSKAWLESNLDRCFKDITARFKLNPLRQPIDAAFAPYYERFLGGDRRAIKEYCEANLYVDDCGDSGIGPFHSFYELVGRLSFFRQNIALKQILADIERAARINPHQAPERIYANWYELLLPLCEGARKSIRDLKKASHPDSNRAKLWRDYIKTAPEALRDWPESESKQFLESVTQFSRCGFVSREMFFDLAKTQPLSKPAVIARHYASKITGVSESWASRKTVRK